MRSPLGHRQGTICRNHDKSAQIIPPMPRSGRRSTTGSRLDLDEPLKSEFADYLAAKDDASVKTVVHRAIRAYMDVDLDKNDGLKERYEELQRARREGRPTNVRLVKPEKSC
jgi:hypothetical protein